MSGLALIVTFNLRPDARDRFLVLVNDNAATSVREEPDCLRLDVLTPPDVDRVILYEIYVDAAAFDRHLDTAHFKAFEAATRDLVLAKTVGRYAVAENAKE